MRPGREWVRLQPLMHQHSLLVLGTGVSPNFALQNQSRIAIAWITETRFTSNPNCEL